MKKYRVIIWGLGNVGRIAVRMCMERESLELVGVIDIAPDKVGKNAGEIFGFGKAGVIVSDNMEKVFALDADVIMCYLPCLMKKGSLKPSADNIVKALKATLARAPGTSFICPKTKAVFEITPESFIS